MSLVTYYRDPAGGESHVVIDAHTTNEDGENITPDGILVYVTDPSDNVIVNGTSMTNVALGRHTYNYDVDADADDGTYSVYVKTTYDGVVSVAKAQFIVAV